MPSRRRCTSLAGTARRVLGFFTRPRYLAIFTSTIVTAEMAVMATTPVPDPDVWWVAAAGREMLATHSVPRENLFSFVEPNHIWLMHEWLLGPPYALGMLRLGPSFFAAVTLASMVLATALVLRATIGAARHAAAGCFLAFCALALFGGRFATARPTGVSLLFPLALAPMAFAPRFGLRSLVLAVTIELIWTNAHGSFPLGVVLLALGAIDRAQDRARRIWAACGCACVTVVNPYGLALHRFVWSYLRGNEGIYRDIHMHIREFGNLASAWGSPVGPVDLFGFALVTTLAVFATLTRYRVRGLFCAAMLGSAAFQVRHLELSGLLACILLVPAVDDLAARWRISDASHPRWRLLATVLILVPGWAFGVALFATNRAQRPAADWIAGGSPYLEAFASVPDGARLFAPFGRAGLAIWYGFPRGVRVLYDSRNDCYSSETYRAFRAIDAARPVPGEVRAALSATGTDAALVPDESPLASLLAREAEWQLVREVRPWRVYVRRQ
jgi:hypothetical protein